MLGPMAEETAKQDQAQKPPAARPAPRNPLPFMIFVAVLCVAGWFLVSWMADSTRIQDCVMSGKKNCAPLDPKLGR